MAEVREISKKRKRLSLPTMHSSMGISTRSKSLIHLHCNLSGQSKPDSNPQFSLKKRKNGSLARDSTVGYGISSASVKDLRLRRVFSPSSTDGVLPNCLDDNENLGKTEFAGTNLLGSQESCENGDLKKLGLSNNEEFMQSTPPDAEIFGRNGSDISDQLLEKTTSENYRRNDGFMEKSLNEERNGMNSSIKSVLKPCSRVKVFKTPGSFSYRRLLPFLMDIEKDHSRTPTVSHCHKIEKDLEEKQLLASHSQETLADKCKRTSCSLESQNNGSGIKLNAVSVESLTSQEETESSSIPFVIGEVQKISCEDQNLNCGKHDSSSTIEDSHFNKEAMVGVVSKDIMSTNDVAENNVDSSLNWKTIVGVVSTDKILTDDIAKTDAESPCNAPSLKHSIVNDKCESCNCDEDTNQSETEKMPTTNICYSFKAQQLNTVNIALNGPEGNQKCSFEQRVENDAEVLDQVEDSSGKCMSLTPPDLELSSKSETDGKRGNGVNCLSQGRDHATEKSTNKSLSRNSGQYLDSSPKNKLVHLTLSKIPGSFSYRRLLPFLIYMTNDQSCASKNDQSKSSEETPPSPFFTNGKETCMETSEGKSCLVEHYTSDDVMLPKAAATATRGSSNDKMTQSPPKTLTDFPATLNSQQEQASLVNHAALGSNGKLETSTKDVVEPPVMSLSSLIDSGSLPREEGAKSISYQLPPETEKDCIKSNLKCATFEKQIKADSFVEASVPHGIPTAGLRKGILKRNPHGCRGICTCLNCSSFRLHAERSFEFSRNQMQDAEEVALDLIKELSYVRVMLEKSAFGANDHTSICINEVKDACKKASDAEELAKARLSEMNYNLSIHCRLPCEERPSVRFANYVEEKVIPVADSINN